MGQSVRKRSDRGRRGSLVSSRPRYLLAILVQHRRVPRVVRSSQLNNLPLPVLLLSHELVDLIVEISDLVVRQADCKGKSSKAGQLSKPHLAKRGIVQPSPSQPAEKSRYVLSWILDTFLEISRRISPLHRSQSLRLSQDEASLGRRSFLPLEIPSSTA